MRRRRTQGRVTSWWVSNGMYALVRNDMEHILSLTTRNRAGVVFSGHRSETCNHLREPRKVLGEKKS